MATIIIGTVVIGLAAFIIYRKTKQLANGENTCSDCSSCGHSCSSRKNN
ncbi:FeoB-associated Cys-rich membrane protein [Clostridiaceae bacterium M8S5]|nr:FeoB-associated Cys-rich membrane protein [Clostridiaceae bacterium M8S5]